MLTCTISDAWHSYVFVFRVCVFYFSEILKSILDFDYRQRFRCGGASRAYGGRYTSAGGSRFKPGVLHVYRPSHISYPTYYKAVQQQYIDAPCAFAHATELFFYFFALPCWPNPMINPTCKSG